MGTIYFNRELVVNKASYGVSDLTGLKTGRLPKITPF
jgi:hypothetical protein